MRRTGSGRFAKVVHFYRVAAVMVFTTLLIFLLVNLVAALFLRFLPARQLPVVAKYGQKEFERVYNYLTPEQIRQLMHECWGYGIAYEPYLHIREPERHGEYVNVDKAGFRHSTNQCAWPPNPGHFNVFVFGGSTTFGYGVADAETVASQLGVVLSKAMHTNVCIYNFGRCYYQCTQERLLFEQLLIKGAVPNMAIFIDGLNDWYFPDGTPTRDPETEKLMAGFVGSDNPALKRANRWTLPALELMNELHSRNVSSADADDAGGAGSTPTLDEKTLQVISIRYIRNMALLNRIATGYGVETWFVWQPVPTYKYDTQYHYFASGIGKHWRSKRGYEYMAQARSMIPFPPNFLWCADMQENLKEPLYVDAVHYSREMNQRVAAEIVNQIQTQRSKSQRVEAPGSRGK